MNNVMNKIEFSLSGSSSASKLTVVMASATDIFEQVEELVTSIIDKFSPAVSVEVHEILNEMAALMNDVSAQVEAAAASGDVAARDVKGGGLLSVVQGLVDNVSGHVDDVEGLLEEVESSISPSDANTLADNLKQVNAQAKKVQQLIDVGAGQSKLKDAVSKLDSTVDDLEKTVADVVKQLDPAEGKELNSLLQQVSKSVGNLESQVKGAL